MIIKNRAHKALLLGKVASTADYPTSVGGFPTSEGCVGFTVNDHRVYIQYTDWDKLVADIATVRASQR